MLTAALPAEVRQGLSAQAYAAVRRLLRSQTGIELGEHKQTLVYSRLVTRLQATGCDSFDAYVQHLLDPLHGDEQRLAMELLTTNETYCYREPEHFDALRGHARRIAARRGVFNAWSAASASGEEAYTMAMVLQAEVDAGLPLSWDILGSDISTRMLDVAARGVYPDSRVAQLPPALQRRYCLRGTGPASGTVLVDKPLRARVRWQTINLIEPLPAVGPFDVIFLRNVLIYFDRPTKQQVLQALATRLRPDGLLVVGLADGVLGLTGSLRNVAQGVYAAGPC